MRASLQSDDAAKNAATARKLAREYLETGNTLALSLMVQALPGIAAAVKELVASFPNMAESIAVGRPDAAGDIEAFSGFVDEDPRSSLLRMMTECGALPCCHRFPSAPRDTLLAAAIRSGRTELACLMIARGGAMTDDDVEVALKALTRTAALPFMEIVMAMMSNGVVPRLNTAWTDAMAIPAHIKTASTCSGNEFATLTLAFGLSVVRAAAPADRAAMLAAWNLHAELPAVLHGALVAQPNGEVGFDEEGAREAMAGLVVKWITDADGKRELIEFGIPAMVRLWSLAARDDVRAAAAAPQWVSLDGRPLSSLHVDEEGELDNDIIDLLEAPSAWKEAGLPTATLARLGMPAVLRDVLANWSVWQCEFVRPSVVRGKIERALEEFTKLESE